MIAQPDCSAELMQRALAYTISALDAVAELDIDLTDSIRESLAKENSQLQVVLDNLLNAQQTLQNQQLKEGVRLQARVLVGDVVLDKGIRNGKNRMKLELQRSMPEAADYVFGKNISELVDAELRSEPQLVMQALSRFDQVPDFAGKVELKTSLEKRVEQQNQALSARDEGELTRASLYSSVVRIIADASESLYRLEKRLLDRFPRERAYVKEFFLDVTSPIRSKKSSSTQPPSQ
ncbi:MAG: hypothetical protein FD167_5124 [bacterium]|nr:MAG: hypothetical protein FD167_5124 [bacterium]